MSAAAGGCPPPAQAVLQQHRLIAAHAAGKAPSNRAIVCHVNFSHTGLSVVAVVSQRIASEFPMRHANGVAANAYRTACRTTVAPNITIALTARSWRSGRGAAVLIFSHAWGMVMNAVAGGIGSMSGWRARCDACAAGRCLGGMVLRCALFGLYWGLTATGLWQCSRWPMLVCVGVVGCGASLFPDVQGLRPLGAHRTADHRIALAGCAVGPDYSREPAPVPTEYKELKGWKLAKPSDDVDRGDWWTVYRDRGARHAPAPSRDFQSNGRGLGRGL